MSKKPDAGPGPAETADAAESGATPAASPLPKPKKIPFLKYGLLAGVGLFIVLAAVFGIKYANMYRNEVEIVAAPSTTAEVTESEETIQPLETTSATSATSAAETTPADTTPTTEETEEDNTMDVGNALAVPIYKKERIDPNILNILVLGSDKRADEVGERSDSMILVSYNKGDHSIKLTSFMRDTWINIPGHGWNRLNAAFAYGGVGLAINTINQRFSLDIQNYVIINFQQFIKEIDKIGGVTVDLSADEIRYINLKMKKNVLKVKAGPTKLTGREALWHVRNRHVGGLGDFDRTRRQRETLIAILNKVKSTKNPTTLLSFVNYSMGNVQTNLKLEAIIDISQQVLAAPELTTRAARIPFDHTWNYATKEGRSVIAINRQDNADLLHDFIY